MTPEPRATPPQHEPIFYTVDVTSGKAYKLVGTGHDITRLLTACKETLYQIEKGKLDPEQRHNVIVPARKATN